jgi:hypothetical protein
MKYPKLRIAWSVAWGVVAVLLCVLWVRSYWRWDRVASNTQRYDAVSLGSARGGVQFERSVLPVVDGWESGLLDEPVGPILTPLQWYGTPTSHIIYIPYWAPFLLIAVVSGLPWLVVRRFSLRTLLIATTLVAVVLGLVVWSVRT